MRSGACTVQQTLTAEAASVLKHSLSLARRRGHAQVTPLHVAATLLSSRTSLLRRACLKSQPQQQPAAPSHPLQCRALELCFNVALNRLPTAPAPLFHGQPSLSNALIAALKRAQAHQRRGCIEQQQQQPLLTIKVELEQLVISILDDPSVSRVMREAGFSSTAVKTNIEDSSASSVFQCYSASGAGGVFSSPCSPSHPHAETQREVINPNPFWQTHFLAYATSSDQNPSLLFSPPKVVSSHYFSDSYSASLKEDIKVVFEVFLRKKKRNTVIIADCFSTAEGLVGELMKRLERGDVPAELKQTHFIKFHFAPVTLRFMKKEDVEMNISELKRKLDSVGDGGGVIIYTGDLKWTVDQEALDNGEISAAHYSPVDHLVLEMGRLLADYRSSNAKVWLMAIASYQTYMRCQMRQPSLEVQWSLQAVSVPSGGLGLSLHGSSIPDHSRAACLSLDHPSQVFISNGKDEQDKFNCCPECTSNYEKEAQVFIKSSGQHKQLPPWLQPQAANDNQKDELEELKRKWSRLCQSLHHEERSARGHFGSSNLCNNLQTRAGKSYSYAFSYPWWKSHNSIFPDSSSISFSDSAMKPNSSPPAGSVAKFRRQQSCTIDFNFRNGTQKQQPAGEPSLDTLKNSAGKEVKVTLALGHSSFSESGKLEEGRSDHLCELLQENVPWQSEIMPSLAEALIGSKCAKGTDTWILIEGNDRAGKRRLGLAVAESVSGSADLLLHMKMRRRTENEVTASNSAVLERAFRNQERLVVFVEDVDFADSQFMKFLSDRFESGKFGESMITEGRNIGQAIFILTRVGESTTYDDDSKMNHDDSVIQMMLKVSETKPSSLGTTTDHKRKADEREISGRNKTPRVNGKESASSISVEDGTNKKDLFSRQSSNTLDLNLKADEEDEEEDKPGEFSPISSDLTRDTTSDPVSPRSCFLESIKNRFVFHHNQGQKRQMIEFFSSKLTRCFEEVVGDQSVIGFSTEEKVLEELLDGSGSFLNSMFEKWLKEIFQTKLRTVKNIGGGEGIGLRFCFRDKSNKVLEDGFKGTCLPKNFLVSFF